VRLILAALVAATLAIPAAAAGKSPDDFSASDQYVETLPTTRGPSAAEGRKRGRTPLRPAVAAKLRSQGGADAARLGVLATSSDFGAPQGTGGRADKNGAGNRRSSRDATAIPVAAVQAVWEGGGNLLWLLLAILAITGLMVGTVTYQRHKDTNSS
jgi:hypothetical protein